MLIQWKDNEPDYDLKCDYEWNCNVINCPTILIQDCALVENTSFYFCNKQFATWYLLLSVAFHSENGNVIKILIFKIGWKLKIIFQDKRF